MLSVLRTISTDLGGVEQEEAHGGGAEEGVRGAHGLVVLAVEHLCQGALRMRSTQQMSGGQHFQRLPVHRRPCGTGPRKTLREQALVRTAPHARKIAENLNSEHGESDHRSGEMDAFSDRLVLYKREDEATIRTEEEDNAHRRHQRAVHIL